MPSKKPVIAIRTDNSTVQKFQYICDQNNRSMSNYGEVLIKQSIKAYEAEHGPIKVEEEQH